MFLKKYFILRLLETVPEEERPPVLLSLYADGIDRDVPTHSSSNNKLHCTYMNVLNMCAFGCRSRYNYELVMLLHEATLAKSWINSLVQTCVAKAMPENAALEDKIEYLAKYIKGMVPLMAPDNTRLHKLLVVDG
jgi:hypothetical protein